MFYFYFIKIAYMSRLIISHLAFRWKHTCIDVFSLLTNEIKKAGGGAPEGILLRQVQFGLQYKEPPAYLDTFYVGNVRLTDDGRSDDTVSQRSTGPLRQNRPLLFKIVKVTSAFCRIFFMSFYHENLFLGDCKRCFINE